MVDKKATNQNAKRKPVVESKIIEILVRVRQAPGTRKNTESEIRGQIDKKIEKKHNSFTRSLHTA